MNLSKCWFFRTLGVLATAAALLSFAGVSDAQQLIVEMDGLDQANLDTEGNWATTHANVNFAFVYGEIVTENLNPQVPPGMDPGPCTACSTSFHHRSNNTPDGGAIGFGTNQLAFDTAASWLELDLTVNPGNELEFLRVIIKDVDAPTFAAEDLQYDIPLGAPGTKTLVRGLATRDGIFNEKDGVPNFDPGGLGMSELQLQYPFGVDEPRPFMDLTIHSVKIFVPEPSSVALAMLGVVAISGFGKRRRSSIAS